MEKRDRGIFKLPEIGRSCLIIHVTLLIHTIYQDKIYIKQLLRAAIISG